MKQLVDHITNPSDPANKRLEITALDKPSKGEANRDYEIKWQPQDKDAQFSVRLLFQGGSIQDVGINGITNEALLAIVMDRLRSFQDGPKACRENEVALTRIEEALSSLKSRTKTERGGSARA